MLPSGSSPRLRGTQVHDRLRDPVHRFIPAPAGNTRYVPRADANAAVHPRACGEHRSAYGSNSTSSGSSPRLRGTRARQPSPPGTFRFIPAPAGNTIALMILARVTTVHPRACGEHLERIGIGQSIAGSSPRLRGTRDEVVRQSGARRFIPAPAGNTRLNTSSTVSFSVHPRACGEHQVELQTVGDTAGSSPRLRGTRDVVQRVPQRCRFIPAPAGNTHAGGRQEIDPAVHPRACGEHWMRKTPGAATHGSSPRLRGTLAGNEPDIRAVRFIPAPAGNTACRSSSLVYSSVHPRACGEHLSRSSSVPIHAGSSPRLRGTHFP